MLTSFLESILWCCFGSKFFDILLKSIVLVLFFVLVKFWFLFWVNFLSCCFWCFGVNCLTIFFWLLFGVNFLTSFGVNLLTVVWSQLAKQSKKQSKSWLQTAVKRAVKTAVKNSSHCVVFVVSSQKIDSKQQSKQQSLCCFCCFWVILLFLLCRGTCFDSCLATRAAPVLFLVGQQKIVVFGEKFDYFLSGAACRVPLKKKKKTIIPGWLIAAT